MASVCLGWMKVGQFPKSPSWPLYFDCLPSAHKKILRKKIVEVPLPPDFLEILDLSSFVFKLILNYKNKCFWSSTYLAYDEDSRSYGSLFYPELKGKYLPSITGNVHALRIQNITTKKRFSSPLLKRSILPLNQLPLLPLSLFFLSSIILPTRCTLPDIVLNAENVKVNKKILPFWVKFTVQYRHFLRGKNRNIFILINVLPLYKQTTTHFSS